MSAIDLIVLYIRNKIDKLNNKKNPNQISTLSWIRNKL